MIFRGVPVSPREFNIATLFFVEVNISPNPLIVPSLSEIRYLSIIALSPPAWFSHGHTLKYNVKMTKFPFYGKRKQATTKFYFSFLT